MQKISATQLLRDEHKKLKGLFRQAEAVDVRVHEMRAGVYREIFMDLEIHGALEEEFLYPEAKSAFEEPDKIRVESFIAAHQAAQNMIDELRDISIGDPRFSEKFQDLMESMELHMEEEENFLFHKAEQVMSDRLINLGSKMQKKREELEKNPKYEFDKPEYVQNPHGGEQSRIRKTA